MKVILSTRNPSKVLQIKAMFAGLPISILTLDEAGIEGEGEENGVTLEDNARKKATYARHHCCDEAWVMADDTGIFIDALHGEPGVRSARWAGDKAETDETTQYTLRAMEGQQDRSATFETVVVLISPQGRQYVFSGKVKGTLLTKPRVKPQPEMPYSPIFVPEGENKVWAEMSTEHENRISHRGKAFSQVRSFLKGMLE